MTASQFLYLKVSLKILLFFIIYSKFMIGCGHVLNICFSTLAIVFGFFNSIRLFLSPIFYFLFIPQLNSSMTFFIAAGSQSFWNKSFVNNPNYNWIKKTMIFQIFYTKIEQFSESIGHRVKNQKKESWSIFRLISKL